MGSERTGAGAGLGRVAVGSVLPRVQWKAGWSMRDGAAVGAAPFLSQSEWIWPFWAGSKLDSNNNNDNTYACTLTERERESSQLETQTYFLGATHTHTYTLLEEMFRGGGDAEPFLAPERHPVANVGYQAFRRRGLPKKYFSFPLSTLILNKNWTAKEFDVYGPFELLNSELKTSVETNIERTKGHSS